MIQYRDLYFGMSDSRNERARVPEHFLRSYVNLNGLVEKVVAGDYILVLGPKGTGKSALAWYMEATGKEDGYLASVHDASKLPLGDIPQLKTGQAPSIERTVAAWYFILLCNYIDLLLRDPECTFPQRRNAERTLRIVRDYGLLGGESGGALLKLASTTVTIPGAAHRGSSPRGEEDLTIYKAIPLLLKWATAARSPKRHILMIDGLDSIFLNDPRYDESLSSLVQATYQLNQELIENRSSGSVVLLLRNDIFARISFRLPDVQKIKDDLGCTLDWRVLSGAAGYRAPLFQLVNRKAAQDLDVDSIDVLEYFPRRIFLAGGNRDISVLRYILNLTRHTPRDVLRLFEEIRKVDASGTFPTRASGLLSQEAIREGVLQYSTQYFVGAISNEFAGVQGGAEVSQAGMGTLQSLGKQVFTAAEFKNELRETYPQHAHQGDDLLRLLFFAGAIGNYVPSKRETYMQFYHRRDHAEVHLSGQLILANPLVHAWSMPFTEWY